MSTGDYGYYVTVMRDGVPDPTATVEFEPAGEPIEISGPPLDALLGYAEPSPDDPLWWMSFCDPSKAPPRRKQRPGGPSFLGGAVIQGPTLAAAITRSHLLGVNPGGEVAAQGPIPPHWIGQEWRDRLLTADEVRSVPEPENP